jgi:hypothetical protein
VIGSMLTRKVVRMRERCQVFISHAHDDLAVVREIESQLSGAGFRVLVDGSVAPSKDWVAAVQDDVRVADVFVVLLSGDPLASGFAMTEFGFVTGAQSSRGGLLLTVLLSGAEGNPISEYLRRFQMIDGRGVPPVEIAGMIADAIANAGNIEQSALAASA